MISREEDWFCPVSLLEPPCPVLVGFPDDADQVFHALDKQAPQLVPVPIMERDDIGLWKSLQHGSVPSLAESSYLMLPSHIYPPTFNTDPESVKEYVNAIKYGSRKLPQTSESADRRTGRGMTFASS
jgi:hypothetical protein